MADESTQALYGFAAGSEFDAYFSKLSIESILFYTFAVAVWVLESLFDVHKDELTTLISTKKPHRIKWYVDKGKAFQFGRSLPDDTDVYNEIVESEMIVKHCAGVEYQGKLYMKIAKGTTEKQPLTADEHTALEAYYEEIKDAGVVLEVVNKEADHFAIEMDIYYDPMVYAATGLRLDTGADTVRDTIKDYIQNKIPFNGEYRNADLVDVLQKLDGVIIPELRIAKTCSNEEFEGTGTPPWSTISAKHLSVSGYYKVYDEADLQLNFIAYQTIESI